MWFVTRRRYEQELAAAKAEIGRQRRRAEKAEQDAATAVFNRGQVLVQNAGLHAANRRLKGRVLELGRRNSALSEADPEYAASLEHRVARLLKVGARILAAYRMEKRRADRLQDAPDLNSPQVENGRYWQHTRNDHQMRKEPTT
ncbi:hypothetical protein ACWEQ7_04010 [Streptomyces sp. NPDC004069]